MPFSPRSDAPEEGNKRGGRQIGNICSADVFYRHTEALDGVDNKEEVQEVLTGVH